MDVIEVAALSDQPESAPARLRSISELPSPKAWPLVGHTFQIKTEKLHQQLEQWSRELGGDFTVRIGNRQFLILSNHQAIAKALRERPAVIATPAVVTFDFCEFED